MPIVHSALRAGPPWESSDPGLRNYREDLAPRKGEVFTCGRGHVMALSFAADAQVPDFWACRHCGTEARRDGAPGDAAPRPEPPGSGRRERPGEDVTPMAQLRKRRSPEDGYRILAEALERVRASGAAR